MKKTELVRRLADQEAITPAAAADHLDHLIFEVLKRFKLGRAASFPGVDRILKPGDKTAGPIAEPQPKPRKAGVPK